VLAEALGLALGLPVVASDPTRKHLGGLRPTDRGPAALYTAAMTERTYDEVIRRAALVVRSGRGVILDATFGDARHREAARALAADSGRPFRFVEVTCDEPTLRARLRARNAGGSVSDAREPLLSRMMTARQPPDELPPGERLVVDGTAPPAALVAAVTGAVVGPT
jgi:predicted kinase